VDVGERAQRGHQARRHGLISWLMDAPTRRQADLIFDRSGVGHDVPCVGALWQVLARLAKAGSGRSNHAPGPSRVNWMRSRSPPWVSCGVVSGLFDLPGLPVDSKGRGKDRRLVKVHA
jgi:hypothetical protein